MNMRIIFGLVGAVAGLLFGVFVVPFSPHPLPVSPITSILKKVSTDDIYCQLDDPAKAGSQIEVPITVQNGRNTNQIPPLAVGFDNIQATVIYEHGDQYETQTYLSLSLWHGTSSVNSTMYDYIPKWNPGPINTIYYQENNKNIRLQCGFANTD